MTDESGAGVSAERREELLDRIARRGSTIGQRIPEAVTIEGQEIALRSFVWETKKQGVVPPDKRESVQRVRATLNCERDRLKERLRDDPLTTEEAESIADTIVGLDRAITALKSLREPDLQKHAHEEYIESNKRWMNFINQLL
jgi:predicted Rdx family selenoprotein